MSRKKEAKVQSDLNLSLVTEISDYYNRIADNSECGKGLRNFLDIATCRCRPAQINGFGRSFLCGQ